jgi:hypothetical protein
MDEKITVRPVEIKDFSLTDASQILGSQDPTRLPQWQIHGDPLVVGSDIRVVMIKLDRIAPPTIVTPPTVGTVGPNGPFLIPHKK